jgi:hypothetical protein
MEWDRIARHAARLTSPPPWPSVSRFLLAGGSPPAQSAVPWASQSSRCVLGPAGARNKKRRTRTFGPILALHYTTTASSLCPSSIITTTTTTTIQHHYSFPFLLVQLLPLSFYLSPSPCSSEYIPPFLCFPLLCPLSRPGSARIPADVVIMSSTCPPPRRPQLGMRASPAAPSPICHLHRRLCWSACTVQVPLSALLPRGAHNPAGNLSRSVDRRRRFAHSRTPGPREERRQQQDHQILDLSHLSLCHLPFSPASTSQTLDLAIPQFRTSSQTPGVLYPPACTVSLESCWRRRPAAETWDKLC